MTEGNIITDRREINVWKYCQDANDRKSQKQSSLVSNDSILFLLLPEWLFDTCLSRHYNPSNEINIFHAFNMFYWNFNCVIDSIRGDELNLQQMCACTCCVDWLSIGNMLLLIVYPICPRKQGQSTGKTRPLTWHDPSTSRPCMPTLHYHHLLLLLLLLFFYFFFFIYFKSFNLRHRN